MAKKRKNGIVGRVSEIWFLSLEIADGDEVSSEVCLLDDALEALACGNVKQAQRLISRARGKVIKLGTLAYDLERALAGESAEVVLEP